MSLRIENGTPINIPHPGADIHLPHSDEFTGHAVHRGNSLGIPHVSQRPFTRLCWAACTTMILSVFEQDVRMCRVAEFLLDRDCCNGNGHLCNRDCEIEDILRIFNNFQVDATRLPHQVSFESIQEQIDDRARPLEIQISWEPGGHVIVIDGWRQSNQIRYVQVKDPWYDEGEVRFSDLFKNYTSDNGKWVGTWIAFREI
jgi:hypothetical protein